MESKQEHQLVSRQVVKKITAKVVCGKISMEDLIEYNKAHGKEKPMPLFGIIGKASDFTTGDGDFGPFVKLLGQFKATSVKTGEVFRSGAAILPGSANDLVYGALRGLGEAGGQIEFAFRVSVKRDETTPTGYSYVVEQIIMENEADALTALEQKLIGATSSNVQQLPNLEQSEEKATGTGSKKK